MISKNNHQFYQQKNVEKKQRWGLRKLSVGVASVLLGTTFMLHSNHAVSADTVASDATPSTTTQADNKGTGTEGTTYTLQPSGDSNATTDNGKDQKVTSPQPALVQKNVTPTASTDAVADYTPATPTTDKAGVTTGVYNNPLVTSSDWIN